MARCHAWLYHSATRGACRAMIAWLWRDRAFLLHIIRSLMLCNTRHAWPVCARRNGADITNEMPRWHSFTIRPYSALILVS
jgi:hypothetical protein